jgi:threonine dehydratase
VKSLTKAEAAKGVCTHSSGNHASGLALAAKTAGIPAYIVMPSNAPSVKKSSTEGYDANVIMCEPTMKSREATCASIVAERGATMIHPYNDNRVMSGQGTVAVEMI